MPVELNTRSRDFEAQFASLLAARGESAGEVDAVVAAIVEDVQRRGDAALIDYTHKFDRVTLSAETMALSAAQIEDVAAKAPKDAVRALHVAAKRITAYHRKQMPAARTWTDAAGVQLGFRWSPISSAGLYVPGGTAAYPSSVLMNALPARVAGVERLIIAVPAPDGRLNPLVMAAARIAGVDAIYRIGGAQAIAALAYGTATIPKVDKIVGPGNAYVAAAKRMVFGAVGIDMVAGPSEVAIVADEDNDPDWIAADLMAQAEHDEDAQSILITDSAKFATATAAAVERLLAVLPRAEIARASWARHGAVIVVRDLDEAPDLVDRLAPEHLQLAVARPDGLAAKIRHAGAIFLGRSTPEALGDYVAGPSHVLPTAGTARFSSGLGVHDFLKRTSIIGAERQALDRLGPAAVTLARAEGLEAHARSVEIRLGRNAR